MSDGTNQGARKSYVVNLDEVDEVQGLSPAEGWFDMKVQFLIDALHGGSTQFVFGRATFVPGAAHEWHRHPNAEEFVCLVQGSGIALNGDEEVPIGVGDVVFTPRNEWHGFRNDSQTETAVMLWGWCGASDKASAGYVVREPGVRGASA